MTNPTKDANAILMGTGTPGAKFPTIGTIVSGTVASEPKAVQQTDFRTKLPEFWKDGSPKMQVVVELQTNLRDPEIDEDNGIRALYINGKNLTEAVRQAVKDAHVRGMHTGGVLTVQFTGEGPAEVGMNPPKLYAAHYQPPVASFNGITGPAPQAAPVQQQIQYAPQAAPVQQFVPQAQPVQYAPQAAPQPAAQPVPQPAPVRQHGPQPVDVAVDAAPTGVDPTLWARMNEGQRAALMAAVAQPAY